MSVPCPQCGAFTEVLRTWREGALTMRERQCRKHHAFATVEAAQPRAVVVKKKKRNR